jgi:hypothetical protein
MPDKLSFSNFAKVLVNSGDLDPDYIFINRVAQHLKNGKDFKAFWMIVKSVIYNSESELRFIFKLENFSTLKYGNERVKSKHSSVVFFNEFINEVKRVEKGYYGYFKSLPKDANLALNQLQKIKGIGKWAAWKLLDLANCCLDLDFDFSNIDFRVAYDFPLKGVLMLNNFNEKNLSILNDDFIYNSSLNKAISLLQDSRFLKAPPSYTRMLNIQEFETLFCKYHSYIHNKYEPLEDLNKLKNNISNSNYERIRALRPLLDEIVLDKEIIRCK